MTDVFSGVEILRFDVGRAQIENLIDGALASDDADVMRDTLATLKRMAKEGTVAVTNPGQVRYVRYYDRALREGFPIKTPTVVHTIQLLNLPGHIRRHCNPVRCIHS